MDQFSALEQEERIIRYIFDNHIIQSRLLPHIDSKFFADESISNLVKNIEYWRKKYEKFPKADTLYSKMKNKVVKEKFKKIMTTPVSEKSPAEIQDMVEEFFKTRMALNILKDQMSAIAESNTDKIAESIEPLAQATNFKLDIDIGLDFDEDIEEVLRREQEEAGAVPSGLMFVNHETSGKKTTGGWYRKALSIFVGEANVGKSLLMCNEAAYSYRTGHHVLYITLELEDIKILERIYANVTDIPYQEIPVGEGESVEERARLFRQKISENKHEDGGSIIVKRLPSGTTRPMDIEQIIQEVQMTKGYGLDMVVIDYIGEMAPNSGGRNADKRYEAIGNIARQLRNIAYKYNVAVLTGSQVNRDGYGVKEVSMRNTSDSAVLNHVADFMVTITQDSLLKQHFMLCQKIIKNRFGRRDEVYFTRIWYDYMRVKDCTDGQVQEYTASMGSEEDTGNSFNKGAVKKTPITSDKVDEDIPIPQLNF